MGKVKVIFGCALLALVVSTGWQIAASELGNYELQDELKDLGSLNSTRIGLSTPKSDDDLREAVIEKASRHGIVLDPSQITVERWGTAEYPRAYLAVDYKARIILPGFTLTLHFRPTSGEKQFASGTGAGS
jgi:hypothetical protein